MKKAPKKSYEKSKGVSTQERKRRASKKSALETLYTEEVIEMFVRWFKKQDAGVGHVMSKEDVLKNIIKNLDTKQDDVLEKAMTRLEKSGFMSRGEDGFSLILTEKGAKSLDS